MSIKIKAWEDFYLDWLQEVEGKDVFIAYFESLNDNLAKSLTDIANFLGVEVDRSRLECTIKHSEGHFHRQNKDTNSLNEQLFSLAKQERIKLAIKRVNAALLALGKKRLPVEKYDYLE